MSTNINFLIKKGVSTLKYEGSSVFLKKALSYTKRKIIRQRNSNIFGSSYQFKDVLFINGCSLPHPPRYRVDHQIEQLHFCGYSCDSVYYENLDLEMVKFYRAFVFFRCHHTELIEKFILRAKYFNKTTFFDVDDLIIHSDYVKDIKYLNTMSKHEFNQYIDGVNRINQTLQLCEYGITTTTRLAEELRKYMKDVFINRNVASEKMVDISSNQLKVGTKHEENKVILGYFSGSITHNDDFEIIINVLRQIFEKYPYVYLKVVGILDIPYQLESFRDRILIEKFADWTKLPQLISEVDINLAPLVNSIFNEAKSENKWTEAALVKVPTIASRVGAFHDVISHEINGVLCSTEDEWLVYLDKLITDYEYRSSIGQKAFNTVNDGWTTSSNNYKLFEFIESKLKDNIAFILPSTQTSGGVNVVIKHSNILREAGKDVTIISMGDEDENIINIDGEINVISSNKHLFHAYFRKAVATLWTTTQFLNSYTKIKQKYYLVQGFETDFLEPGHHMRSWINLTYNFFAEIRYITISKWCEKWLKNKYNKNASYGPNGIDLRLFKFKEREFKGKIKILIEGNSSAHYKNVDESFEITNLLDPEKFEIHYLSYNGKPKSWYRVDRFFNNVPHDEVSKIYSDCDILLKSSLLESFSYPPLEMMATGGVAVVSPNEGNMEYLIDGENCLFYEQGNIDNAITKIELICKNKNLRDKLIINGQKTADSRSWSKIKDQILELYDYQTTPERNGEKNEACSN